MQCEQVIKLLSAWADHEISAEEKKALEQHLAVCAGCRARAATYEKLAAALDDLPPIRAPRGFSNKVRRAARASVKSVDTDQWWQQLSLAWRGTVCAMTAAGLLFGAVLGTSLPTDTDGADSTGSALSYFTISDDGDFY